MIFRFPLNDKQLMDMWLKNIDSKDFSPTSQSLLCSDHFEENCYRINSGKLRIKSKAVPTKFNKIIPCDLTGCQKNSKDIKF